MLRGLGVLMVVMLVVGVAAMGANASVLTRSQFQHAYTAAKANAPCLTTDERTEIRAAMSQKAWTTAVASYTKAHGWAADDPRVYAYPLQVTIQKDASVEYLGYLRTVGRAYVHAQSVNAQGAACSQIVMAALHHAGLVVDGVTFMTESDLLGVLDQGGGGDDSGPGGFAGAGDNFNGGCQCISGGDPSGVAQGLAAALGFAGGLAGLVEALATGNLGQVAAALSALGISGAAFNSAMERISGSQERSNQR